MSPFLRRGLFVLLFGIVGLAVLHYSGVDQTPDRRPSPVSLTDSASSTATSNTGGQVQIATWNLANFGRTKDAEEIGVAAETLRDFDLVAVQEVVTSPPGAQAIGALDQALDRTGFAWDYRLSDPTTGPGTERYAFLWKPSRVRLIGRAWLEASLADSLDREPYMARFEHRASGQRLLLASFHAVPTSKNPAREIALLDRLHNQYETDHLVILGDFNLDADDDAFNELRRLGYAAVLQDQPTSLRRIRRDGPKGHLASEYDNIFVETGPLRSLRAGTHDFTGRFSSLKEARSLSDHLPVYAEVEWIAPPPTFP